MTATAARRPPLYTPEERVRRDQSVWTVVQGVLAPIQFVVMLVSVGLIARYLSTGEGLAAANISVLVKTVVLLTIMVTGSIWEKVVFDCWLFAKAFFWEDVVSFLVIAVHLWYCYGLWLGGYAPQTLMYIALAAYGAYTVNAVQFILKLRAARLQEAEEKRMREGATAGTADAAGAAMMQQAGARA